MKVCTRKSGTKHSRFQPGLRRVVGVLVFFLVVHYLLLPQLVGARASVSVLARLNPWLLALSVAFEAASVAAYAQLTRSLLPKTQRPALLTIVKIQLATLATSHVLPGGSISSAPVGLRLLQRAGVDSSDAGFVLAVQPIGSAAVLNVMLWVALLVSIPVRGANAAYATVALAGLIVVSGFVAVLVGVSRGSKVIDRFMETLSRKLPFVDAKAVGHFLQNIVDRAHELASDRRLLRSAAGWAAAQWLADAACLWLVLAAVGTYLSPDALLVAFGLANVAAAIPLTPGGLGVYEAVLTSTLVGFGVPSAAAIVAVLAYRVLEFWLPIPIGAIAYVAAKATDETSTTEEQHQAGSSANCAPCRPD